MLSNILECRVYLYKRFSYNGLVKLIVKYFKKWVQLPLTHL